jgi:hypothetical protein
MTFIDYERCDMSIQLDTACDEVNRLCDICYRYSYEGVGIGEPLRAFVVDDGLVVCIDCIEAA